MYDDGTYLAKQPTWHAEDSPWKASQIVRMLERNDLKPRTVCEVGCGAGEILNRLSECLEPGTQFSGYEISPQAFELCKTRSRENLTFHLGDLLEEDTPHFDLVMAIDVFEHVPDYLGFLRALKAKGEYKLFHIPLDITVLRVLRRRPIVIARRSLGHLHYFTKETALASLRDTGYTIRDHFYTGPVDALSRRWQSRLLGPLRRALFWVNPDVTVRVLGGYSLMVLAE
jgi:cyclopropane fatty-acyl-phospholipid synthase-like methyltransferase